MSPMPDPMPTRELPPLLRQWLLADGVKAVPLLRDALPRSSTPGSFTDICIGWRGSMADVLDRSTLYTQRGATGRL